MSDISVAREWLEDGRKRERARIVAWLRERGDGIRSAAREEARRLDGTEAFLLLHAKADATLALADAIERGDHERSTPND